MLGAIKTAPIVVVDFAFSLDRLLYNMVGTMIDIHQIRHHFLVLGWPAARNLGKSI
jgi:hypothetical protein